MMRRSALIRCMSRRKGGGVVEQHSRYICMCVCMLCVCVYVCVYVCLSVYV